MPSSFGDFLSVSVSELGVNLDPANWRKQCHSLRLVRSFRFRSQHYFQPKVNLPLELGLSLGSVGNPSSFGRGRWVLRRSEVPVFFFFLHRVDWGGVSLGIRVVTHFCGVSGHVPACFLFCFLFFCFGKLVFFAGAGLRSIRGAPGFCQRAATWWQSSQRWGTTAARAARALGASDAPMDRFLRNRGGA